MHENHAYGDSVKPGGKSRFAAKSPDLPIELEKGFLRQIFGLGHVVFHHTQAKAKYPPPVFIVEKSEGLLVALLSHRYNLTFGKLDFRHLLPPSVLSCVVCALKLFLR